jgi:hypothetical protein
VFRPINVRQKYSQQEVSKADIRGSTDTILPIDVRSSIYYHSLQLISKSPPICSDLAISRSTMAENGSNVSKLRNARACEACRASKSRCFFRNQQNICQRCEQSGNQCIVRTKARPMRTKAAWVSFSCSNPFISLITCCRHPGQNSAVDQLAGATDSDFSINLPTVTALDSGADVEELFEHHKAFFADDEEKDQLCGSTDRPRTHMPLIEQRKVDRKEAEQLLLAFRSKAPFFPFVHIPSEATVPSLSRNSPFLLLAILTVASFPDPKLHHQMDHEFRRVQRSLLKERKA